MHLSVHAMTWLWMSDTCSTRVNNEARAPRATKPYLQGASPWLLLNLAFWLSFIPVVSFAEPAKNY